LGGMDGILNISEANSAIRYPSLELEYPNSEVYLLQQAVRRDRTAFSTLYDLHIDRVYKFVFYWLPSQADAEDITQEVFVRAWRSIDKYKVSESPFIAWLITIARNLVNSHYRSVKRLVPLDDMDPAGDSNPQKEAEINFTRDYVRDAIMKLKGDKQSVIQMRFISEMSYEEVAKAMNKSEGAVRVLQYRALKELKGIMEKSNR
jgi:RNA polymerase sigma-70 factor (ECF subfamily)